MAFSKTEYKVKCLSCGGELSDEGYPLGCPHCDKPGFIQADYGKKQIEFGSEEMGLYRFADWLPVKHTLEGSGAPITYKSEALAKELGLTDLWITFNGWWPEKGARMKTGAFKECEAYAVCGRMGDDWKDTLVVASAGNTARAFARVCSDNNIPLVLCVPEDNIDALWFDKPLNDCVKLYCTESGSDYFDAIALSGKVCALDGFAPEGGAKNIARRDGMATTVLSCAEAMQAIPEYYFQAVGSGTGAIAAWEAMNRLIEDGRFGSNKMKLLVSQNTPFLPIYDSWKRGGRDFIELDGDTAREQAEAVVGKVLTNRKPPYSLTGGLYDALVDTEGDVIAVSNEEASQAGALFKELEGNDVSPAASVAVASLIQAVEAGTVPKDGRIMLNITGGGMERFMSEHEMFFLQPTHVFSKEPSQEEVAEVLKA
ncbi:MAG: cysteate synthase [Spirochaetales bacterium]|nr:cysteate synthase [Spirochaetales bacterium]